MADIVRCKIDGFTSFHIQTKGHFSKVHPDLDYYENTEILGDSDADLKKYGFRPSIEYYKAKLQGKNVTPYDFEKRFGNRVVK